MHQIILMSDSLRGVRVEGFAVLMDEDDRTWVCESLLTIREDQRGGAGCHAFHNRVDRCLGVEEDPDNGYARLDESTR